MKKYILPAGAILIILTVGVVGYVGFKFLAPEKQGKTPEIIEESAGQAGVNPITNEVVEDKNMLDPVREYLKKVSPDNFKEDFMASVGNDTVSAYEQYSTSTDAAVRLDAARLFHLSLNNAIVNRGDEKYVDFLTDVQKDLEAALGQSLY